MLLTLAVWTFLSWLACCYGILARQALRAFFDLRSSELGPALTAILGLVALTTFAGVLALAVPLAGGASLILFAGSLGIAARHRRTLGREAAAWLAARRARPAGTALLLLAVAAVLAWTCVPTGVYDTGAYHLQALRWIERYPAVPGLANLEVRLALVPVWFLPAALTGFSFLGPPLYVVNGWLTLAVIACLLEGIEGEAPAPGRSTAFWFRVGALPGALLLADEILSSPTPDLPIQLFWLLLLALAVPLAAAPGAPPDPLDPAYPQTEPEMAACAIFVLAVFAVGIRLSALPVLLLALWVARRFRRRLGAVRLAAVALLLSVPWILRDFVQTGYPFYPLPWPVLGALDWRVPAPVVRELVARVAGWARSPGELSASASSWGWLRGWVARLPLFDAIAISASVVAAISAIGALSAPLLARRRPELRACAPLLGIGFAGLLFWFLSAPDPRFGRGLYFGTALLGAVLLFAPLLARLPRVAAPLGMGLLLLFDLARGIAHAPVARSLWRPLPYPAADAAPARLDGLVVWTPVSGLCGYEPFPCAAAPGGAEPVERVSRTDSAAAGDGARGA